MLYYIIPYIFSSVLAILFQNFLSRKNKYFLLILIAIFPSFLLVVLRGDVGTDTYTYLNYFQDLISGNDPELFEYGFRILSRMLVFLSFNARQIICIIAFITTLILCVYFSRTKETTVFFLLAIYPTFYYDMTMNGLRYGLAFAISYFAVTLLYQNKFYLFLFFSIIASLFQASSLLILFIFLFDYLSFKKVVIVVTLTCVTIIISSYLNVLDLTYFYSKQDFYRDLTSPKSSSGLSSLIVFILFYATFIFSKVSTKSATTLHLILFCELLSYIISQFSYSGLRMQALFLFSAFMFIALNLRYIKQPSKFYFVITVIGFISFIFKLNNFAHDDSDVLTPFMPYTFIWNI